MVMIHLLTGMILQVGPFFEGGIQTICRHPGSPKLKMVSWNLYKYLSEEELITDLNHLTFGEQSDP